MPYLAYLDKDLRSATKMALIDMARTICEEYAADGYDLTLRQLYYQFVARDLIPNSQRSYKRLGDAVNDGRMLGLIDWDHITDRTRNLVEWASWDSPEQAVAEMADRYRRDKWMTQPERVEVWVEKEALAGVIEQAASRVGVPYFSCRGYVSQSEMWAAGQRIADHFLEGHVEHVTILHLGDHDPSGIDMSRDIEDRLRTFSEDRLIETMGYDFDDLVRVKRIALNMDQIDLYDPPPNPAKLTDSRAADYLSSYGRQSWELDALEPRVLTDLIVEEVLALRDESLWQDERDRERTERNRLLAFARDTDTTHNEGA